VAKHWTGEQLLTVSALGIGFDKFAHREMLHLAAARTLSAADLKRAQRQLASIYPQGYLTISLEGERFFLLDIIQHTFTKGGFGGGHLIPKFVRPLVEYCTVFNPPAEPDVRDHIIYTAISMLHARRDRTIAKANAVYDQVAEMLKHSPYERHRRNISIEVTEPHNYDVDFASFIEQSRYFVIGALIPAVERMSELLFEGKLLHEATLTVLALQRFQLEKGEFPESLHELINEGYLDTLATDPCSDRPLMYEKTQDDFILYSAGYNFKDDGGKLPFPGASHRVKWGTDRGGDAILWPLGQ
jgi:hypothetical protein